jgi:hypothetical protein
MAVRSLDAFQRFRFVQLDEIALLNGQIESWFKTSDPLYELLKYDELLD